ncbi:MAG: putative colanic acid biosynthesis acetyltransferase [Spirosomataceae bacterium]
MSKLNISLKGSNTRWSFSTKLRRGAWRVVNRTIFKYTPKSYGNIFRVHLLNAFGAKISKNAWVFPSVKINDPLLLEIGEWSVIGPNVNIYNYDLVKIGEQTVISQNVFLCTATHDYTRLNFPLIWDKIIIGDECWIAEGAMIFPNVSIGNGSVVGARSLVTKSILPCEVHAGNPCKFVKKRIINE